MTRGYGEASSNQLSQLRYFLGNVLLNISKKKTHSVQYQAQRDCGTMSNLLRADGSSLNGEFYRGRILIDPPGNHPHY